MHFAGVPDVEFEQPADILKLQQMPPRRRHTSLALQDSSSRPWLPSASCWGCSLQQLYSWMQALPEELPQVCLRKAKEAQNIVTR